MGSLSVLKHIDEVNYKNLDNFNLWLPKTVDKYKNQYLECEARKVCANNNTFNNSFYSNNENNKL